MNETHTIRTDDFSEKRPDCLVVYIYITICVTEVIDLKLSHREFMMRMCISIPDKCTLFRCYHIMDDKLSNLSRCSTFCALEI